jgi:hypothetical protein
VYSSRPSFDTPDLHHSGAPVGTLNSRNLKKSYFKLRSRNIFLFNIFLVLAYGELRLDVDHQSPHHLLQTLGLLAQKRRLQLRPLHIVGCIRSNFFRVRPDIRRNCKDIHEFERPRDRDRHRFRELLRDTDSPEDILPRAKHQDLQTALGDFEQRHVPTDQRPDEFDPAGVEFLEVDVQVFLYLCCCDCGFLVVGSDVSSATTTFPGVVPFRCQNISEL